MILRFIQKKVLTFFRDLGTYTILCFNILKYIPRIFKDRKLIIDQMVHIGVNSLALVSIIGIFTGAVSAWQGAYQLEGLASKNILGSATTKAIIIELGPVLAAIVLAGRIGASISAELGTMKVTEQFDALESMAINPVRYLAMPRVVASVIMTPPLVIYATAVAIIGAYIVATAFLDVTGSVFMNGFRNSFEMKDFYASTIKATCFGIAISTIGCFVGFSTEGGAQGVGLSTIKSFVICSASILILDYILWNFLIG